MPYELETESVALETLRIIQGNEIMKVMNRMKWEYSRVL